MPFTQSFQNTEQLKLKTLKNLANKPRSNIGLLPHRYYLPFQVGDNLDDYYYKMVEDGWWARPPAEPCWV